MAWNQLRTLPADRLNRLRNWEARGIAYWQGRVTTCDQRVANADSSSQLGRALDEREMAMEAVRRLSADAA